MFFFDFYQFYIYINKSASVSAINLYSGGYVFFQQQKY